MNNKHCRPLTDRQNVLHVFAKRNQSQSNIRVIPDCNSDSSRAKSTARSGKTSKVKRLKTRKERCRMAGERRQDVHPPCCHQSGRENKMERSHNCSHNRQLHPPLKENMFTKADHRPEPCFITDGRLIGHHGLFNREVKSVDIERLVSDKMKTKVHMLVAPEVHSGGCRKGNDIALPPCPSLSPASDPADFSASNHAEETWLHEKERTQSGEKAGWPMDCTQRPRVSRELQKNVAKSKTSIQVCLGNNISENVPHSNATVNNSTTSSTTPLQSAVQLGHGLLSFHSEPELLCSSASFSGRSLSKRERQQAQKGDQESPRPAAAERSMEHHADSRGRERGYVCTPQLPSRDCRPFKFFNFSKLCKPDPALAGPTITTGAQSCKDTEGRLLRRAGECAAVAARLCGAVQLPMLCRRNILVESREALLQTLRERHGLQLMENLLKLEQHASCSVASAEVPSVDLGKDSNSDTQASGCAENMAGLEKSCSRRRRKQLFPQKVEPHLPEPQQNATAEQWNPSMTVEQIGDPSGAFTMTNSPPLVMDFLPTLSSSPPTFMSSAWGMHTGPQLTQDRLFWSGPERATIAGERMENSGYSPVMCFFSQSKNMERTKPPFLQYSSFPVEGSLRDVTLWPQRPTDDEMSHFSAYSPPSHRHHLGPTRLQTHNYIHQPPPIRRSYSSDRIYSTRSDMQERALSPLLPLLPSYPSPDHWSFPRMRLY